MKLKRLMLILLSATMLLPTFSACGGDTPADDTTAAETTEAVTEAETEHEYDTGEDTSAMSETQLETVEETETETETDEYLGENVLADPTFRNGFQLLTVSGGLAKNLPGRDGGVTTPVWQVAQWWCNHPLQDGTETITDTTYSITDASKEVTVDWSTGVLTMGLKASREMEQGSTTKWPHLLIEQAIPAVPLKDAESVTATVTFNILENTDMRVGGQGLHAQFSWFIYIQDRNPESEGYNNFLWFGLNLFNSVSIGTGPYAAQDTAGGPGNFIYSLGSSSLLDKRLWIGRPTEIKCDILPHIQKALETAQANGFMLGTELEDVSITGMNIGWENFDRWDVRVTIEDMGIYVK